MPDIGPIDIQFLINSPEVKEQAADILNSLKGITSTGTGEAEKASQIYTSLFQQLSSFISETFGKDKLQGLTDSLQGITDEAQQLSTILKFIKENVSDLKLNPEDTTQLISNVEVLSDGLTGVSGKLKEVGAGAQKAFEEGAQAIPVTQMSVKELEAEMDKLLDKERFMQRALKQTLNPELIQIYKEGIQSLQPRLVELGEELDRLNADKFKEDLDETNKKTANLLTQLRELKYAIADAIAQYGEGSPQVIQLSEQAAELEQRLRNANKNVALMASNTAGLDALKKGFSGLVGGVTAFVSGMALIDGNNEKLQQTMVKLFAVLQLVNGAEQLLTVTNKNSAVVQFLIAQYRKLTATNTVEQAAATEGLAAAEVTQTGATEGATVAQTALNVAMDANPIGIIILAVAALVAGIAILVSQTEDATVAQKEWNDAMAAANDVLIKLVDLQGQLQKDKVTDAQNAVSLAQAQGKSEQEILNLKKQALEAERSEAIYKLASLGYDKQQLGFAEAQLESVREQLHAMQATPASELTKEQKKQLDSLQAQEKSIENIYGAALGYYNTVQKTGADLQNLGAEQQKKALDDSLKSAVAYYKGLTAAAKEGSQAQLQAQIDAINASAKQQLANPNITNGERFQIEKEAAKQISDLKIAYQQKEYENQISLAKAVLDNAEKGYLEEYNAKVATINLTADKEIAAAKGNSDKIKQLNADRDKAIKDTTNQYNLDTTSQEVLHRQTAIKQELAEVQEGSEQELNLKKKLLEAQQTLDIAAVNASLDNEKVKSDKIIQIKTATIEKQKALDEQYLRAQVKLAEQYINSEAARNQLPFDAILNNPSSTNLQKDNAQIGSIGVESLRLQNLRNVYFEAYQKAMQDGSKDAQKYAHDIEQVDVATLKLNNDLKATKEQKLLDQFAEASAILGSVSQGLNSLASALQNTNEGLSDVLGGLGQMAGEAQNMLVLFQKNVTASQQVAVGIQGIVSLIGILANASAQRAQAEQQFNADLIAQQEQYNLALNNAILLNTKLKDNVFVTDYAGEITDGINALTDANDKFQDTLKKLNAVQVVTGQRNAINWNNVLGGAGAGAGIGAAAGSVVPVIGTAIGAAVGAIGGVIAGIFGGKKKVDTLAPILKEYPELIDKSKKGVDQFNDALAQSLIDTKQVTGASADTLKNLIDWKKAVQDAQAQIKDVVNTLAGQLGSNLRDSLVQAFEDGTDAGKAFANSVGNTLQNVLTNMIFNRVFGNAFDKLQQQMEDSFGVGGDENWQDDLQNFFNQYQGLSKQFDDQLKAAQKDAKAAGLDIFQNTNNNQDQQGLTGAIRRSLTEDTGNELAGLMRGQYDTIKRQYQTLMASLDVQNKIEANTANTVVQLQLAVGSLQVIATNTKPAQTSRDLGVG